MHLNPNITEANRKVNFICYRLRVILRRNHFKLNCNLFKVFIVLEFRLLPSLLPHANAKQTQFVDKELRQAFRKFVRLPQSCPNNFIAKILGTLEQMSVTLNKTSEIRLMTIRNQCWPTNKDNKKAVAESKQQSSCRYFPNELLTTNQIV